MVEVFRGCTRKNDEGEVSVILGLLEDTGLGTARKGGRISIRY